MIRSIKNKLYLACLVLALGCTTAPDKDALPFINQPDFTPEWINPGDNQYSKIHRIPPFSFTNQDGKLITEKDGDEVKNTFTFELL